MRWRAHKTRGSLVLVAFCLIAVVGLGLAGYMNACYQSLNHSTREYHSRQARYLAEVGLEEALWQLNNNSPWTGSGPASSTAWTGSNPKSLNVTGYALGSGATGEITVTVNTTTYAITSTAEVSIAGKTYTKTLSATTQYAPQFGNAIASATGTVTFNSDGTIDSYDSSTGAYTAPTSSTGYAAVVAGNNIAINNADVRGYLATYSNTPTYSGIATVKAYGSPASPNVVASRIGVSAFVPIFNVTTASPPGAWTRTLSATSENPTGSAATQYWRYPASGTGTYTLSAGEVLQVNGPGLVKMVINGNLTLSSSGRIQLNSGARLELFVSGNITTSGSGGILNQSAATNPLPTSLALYRTGTGSFSWGTTRPFYGVIYSSNASAPTMTITTNAAFYGAILSRTGITFSGATPVIHYDTALRASTWKANLNGISAPFIVNALTETATER